MDADLFLDKEELDSDVNHAKKLDYSVCLVLDNIKCVQMCVPRQLQKAKQSVYLKLPFKRTSEVPKFVIVIGMDEYPDLTKAIQEKKIIRTWEINKKKER